METEFDPGLTYAKNIDAFKKQLPGLTGRRNLLGMLRLSMVILPLLLVYFLLPAHWLIFIPAILLVISLFLWLVVMDSRNDQEIRRLEILVAINEDELRIASGDFSWREDGKRWERPDHAYASDMDIFGKASLFQFYNRCSAEQGMQLLAERFQVPMSPSRIRMQQEAVKDMKNKIAWRQEWQFSGREGTFTLDTESRILQWMAMKDDGSQDKFWRTMMYIFPMVSLGTLFLFANGNISFPIFLGLVIGFYFFSGLRSKAVNGAHAHLSKIVPQVDTLCRQLNMLDNQTWTSVLLKELQSSVSADDHRAGEALGQLQKILNRFDVRFNALVSPVLNIFFLWDIRQFLQLQSWKSGHRVQLQEWIQTMAETELLVSMSAFSYNHPGYCFPEVDETYFHMEAAALGHPLIPGKKRVVNDCRMEGTGQVMLITGSNMAGKSTFLRSIGVNTALAMIGSAVCASSYKLSHVQLISSMRISDNLAENTSTFYAELKKLKIIIDRVNQKERLLILLDEILRGTNSFDRHAGSEAMVEQLIKQGAIAMVATHDLELGSLETKYPASLHNHHFDVQVKGEELNFDFKLKEGICRSMNASILMKKIGIDMP